MFEDYVPFGGAVGASLAFIDGFGEGFEEAGRLYEHFLLLIRRFLFFLHLFLLLFQKLTEEATYLLQHPFLLFLRPQNPQLLDFFTLTHEV